ncbi:hypothetical protein EZY14_016370 [Kordia sp. TARA_039_SRF]|nr:hypothetical protein EZY14_016370 [Kordia sp. TARA_039_SRF]
MNKGLTILAKVGTTERMIVFLDPNHNNIPEIISEKYGEEWVRVNELCLGDTLKFESDDQYKGFDNRKDNNYCQGALEKGVFRDFIAPAKRFS